MNRQLALVFGSRFTVSLVLASLALGAAFAQTKSAPKKKTSTPDAVVRALYKDHFSHKQRSDLTIKRNRLVFTPELRRLLDEDARKSAAHPDEIVGLDFDIFTNAQEEAIGYEVGQPIYQQTEAVVPVAVKFGPEPNTLRVHLGLVGGRWLVSNIAYDESDLVTILKTPSN